MRGIRVLHFLGYTEDRGGVLTAIRNLSRHGTVEHLIVVDRAFQQRRGPELLTRHTPAVAPESLGPRALWPTWRAALALRHRGIPKRTVVHGQSRAGLLVVLWLWVMGDDGVCASPHSYGRQRWFYRWAALCLGPRLVWLSPAMRRHYLGQSNDWTACIPEPAPRRVPETRRERRVNDNIIVIAGIGTLVEWKGWHLVLEALASLAPAQRNRFRFVHVGDEDGTAPSRDYASRLRHQTVDREISAVVEWRGWASSADAILAEASVVVVPSENEPMSLAGLEALAAGVPLIVADSGGLNDIVAPGRNALLFRTGESGDLARVLRELLVTSFLNQARIIPEDLDRVDTRRVSEAWLRVYRRVLGGEAVDVI